MLIARGDGFLSPFDRRLPPGRHPASGPGRRYQTSDQNPVTMGPIGALVKRFRPSSTGRQYPDSEV